MNEKIPQFLAEKLGMPYMSMRFALADWNIVERPHVDVMVKDNEVHALIKNKFVSRGDFSAIFGPLIKKYGFAMTRCFQDDAESIAFVERMGFRREHEDAKFIHFEIRHIPYSVQPGCSSRVALRRTSYASSGVG